MYCRYKFRSLLIYMILLEYLKLKTYFVLDNLSPIKVSTIFKIPNLAQLAYQVSKYREIVLFSKIL